jgi:hypothetical protein
LMAPRNTEFLAVDAEAMKMIITPGKSDLDEVVEVRECAA